MSRNQPFNFEGGANAGVRGDDFIVRCRVNVSEIERVVARFPYNVDNFASGRHGL